MKSNFLKFPCLKNPPWSHLVESTLRLPHRSSYSTPSLGCKEHSGQHSSKGEMPCLSFSENILVNIHEAPVKGSPSSDHEVGNGQVDQVEVDRRSHRLVEDHLVVEKGGCKRISLHDVLCALADVRGEKNSIGVKRWPKDEESPISGELLHRIRTFCTLF